MSQVAKWREEDIPNLNGKVVLVTGGNSGIGFETIRVVAKKGASVVMASRNLERGQNALDKIKNELPESKIELLQLDLADLTSVEKFCTIFLKKYHRLDYLFNNAGIMMIPYETTPDGHEKQFGTNYLGHFALTGRLLPLIIKT